MIRLRMFKRKFENVKMRMQNILLDLKETLMSEQFLTY